MPLARQVGAGANRICISRLVTFGLHVGKTEVATGSHTEEVAYADSQSR